MTPATATGTRWRTARVTVLAACLALLSVALPVRATDTSDPGLIDGLEILSAYRDLNPEAEAAYRALLERVPAETRRQAEASTWARRQAAMTETELDDAANDPATHIVRTPAGLAAIPRDKLDRAIRGLTAFAVDQKDLGRLLDAVTDRLPSAMRPHAGAIASALESAAGSALARGAAIAGLEGLIGREIATRIEPVSQAIRDDIARDGAAQVLDTARRNVAGPAPQPPASPGSAAESDALARARGVVGRDLPILEQAAEGLAAAAARCEAASAAEPTILELVSQANRVVRMLGEWVDRAEQTAQRAAAVVAVITETKRSADAVCEPGSAAAGAGTAAKLATLSQTAEREHDQTTRDIAAALREFDAPVASPGPAVRPLIAAFDDACRTLRQVDGRVWRDALARLRDAVRTIEIRGGDAEVDIHLAVIQVARLVERIGASERTLGTCALTCARVEQNVRPAIEALEERERRDAALEARRVAVRARLSGLAGDIAQARAGAVGAIERARACIAAQDDRTAEAALEACRFGDSRDAILRLPEGARRTSLSRRWNETYEAEREVRDLVAQAVALRTQGDLRGALEVLSRARARTRCESTVTAVETAIADLTATAEAQAGKADAALTACDFDGSRRLIEGLPQGPRRSALMERWTAARESEQRARALLAEAAALRAQGKPGQALAKLSEAGKHARCSATTRAVAEAATAARTDLPTAAPAERSAAADADCVQSAGPGHRAGLARPDGTLWCVPDQPTANRRCREAMGGIDAVAVDIKSDGTFRCRPTQAAAQADCANRAQGWHATRLRPDGTYDCYPGEAVRTAQCERDNNAKGVRAGPPRREGDRYVWNCYPPAGTAPGRTGVTTRAACPPGSFMTGTGQCLAIGGIMQGLSGAIRGLAPPAPAPVPQLERQVQPPARRATPPPATVGDRCAWKVFAGRRQCMCVLAADPTVERGMDARYCR